MLTGRLLIALVKLLAMLVLAPAVFAAGAPLPPEQAFKFSLRAVDAGMVEAHWKIEPGYYLYRDKFKFAIKPDQAAAAKLGTPSFPPGKVKDDEFFGKVETYRDEVVIPIPIEASAASNALTLIGTAQGCADLGVCYPPLDQQATVQLIAASVANTPAAAKPLPGSEARAAPEGDESSRVQRLLRNASLLTVLLFFFGSGVALAFTPCMFPLVPIISGIIVGHGHAISKVRAVALSAGYVLGMAVTYAVLGVAAGFSGTLISSALQNAWVLSAFAAIFVLLALAMFGFYELQLPGFLQTRLSEEASQQKGGSMHGVLLMGGLSAIIVGPCVAAPLAGALLYIASTGDALLGGSALFIMALGMGLPLLLVGASARHWLPKPGPWMTAVNQGFGVLLLGLAIWLVTPVIPALAQMLAWALLLIFSAIYLHALDPLPPHAHGWQKFGKGLGVLALLLGAALLAGALAGARDPLQPLGFLRAQARDSAKPEIARFEAVKSTAELQSRLASAGRPVLLDFYADWCVSCKEMERYTFSESTVAARMEKMLLLRADVTANDAQDRALLQAFHLFGPPGIVLFTAQGMEIPGLRVVGFQDAAQFRAVLDAALAAR